MLSSRATSSDPQTPAGGRAESSASEAEPYDPDLDYALRYESPEKDTSDDSYEDEWEESSDDDDTTSFSDLWDHCMAATLVVLDFWVNR